MRVCALLSLAAILLLLAPLTAGAAPLPADWQKGADLTTWWHDDYARASSDDAIQALAATGTTHVAVVTTWYMNAGADSSIAPDPQKTPSDDSVRRALAKARSLGMTVTVKPHVDVHDGTFRGDIRPASPAAWFDSYRAMLNRYASLAQEAGADTLVVGTELTSVSGHTDEWRRTIAEARSRFSGKLTFAANWIDGAEQAAFWDALDLIGIDAYMPLSDSDPDPSLDALVSAWYERGYVDRIEALHTRYAKPVLFTEAGFESRLGTAITPWGGASGAISQATQARAYHATYCVWSQLPWFKGIYWWDWRATGFDAGDGTHAPRGKLAESTMRAWNAGTPEGCPAVARTARTTVARTAAPAAAASPPAAGATTSGAALSLTVRGRRLSGRVRSSRCAGRAIRIVLERRGARAAWARSRSLTTRASRSGGFAVRARRLRRGTYRARAIIAAGPCRRAASNRVRFRVR